MSESWKDSRFQCEQLPTCYVKETGSCHFHSYWFLVKPHTVASSVYKLNDETIVGQGSNSTTWWLTSYATLLHSTIINFIKFFCLIYNFGSRLWSTPGTNLAECVPLSTLETNYFVICRTKLHHHSFVINSIITFRSQTTKIHQVSIFSVVTFWLIPLCCSPFSPIHAEPTVNLISDLFVLCFSRGLTLLT